MTVHIRPAGPNDVPAICSLLHEHMNPAFPPERWRQILDYPWRPADADLGRVAVESGRIVGFLGLVYADRRIGGTLRRFANLTSWYLSRDLRGRGIGSRMLADSTHDPEITYTNLTPARATVAMVRAFGFETLDEERLIFSRSPQPVDAAIDLSRGADDVLPRLDRHSRQILVDHAAFDLDHVAFAVGSSLCYLVLQSKRKAGGRLYVEVLFASDREALSHHAREVAELVLPEENAVLAVDRRFLTRAPPGADVEKPPLPRLYKPAGVDRGSVDMLYSEIPLLDLKLP